MQEINNAIYARMETFRLEAIKRHKEAGQYTTGKTARMFRSEIYDKGVRLWGASYAGVLERGRKPGRIPYNFVDILVKWARDKGLNFKSQSDAKSWAWWKAQRIKEEGTRMYAEGRTEDIFTTPLEELKKGVIKDVKDLYKAEIKNQIFKK